MVDPVDVLGLTDRLIALATSLKCAALRAVDDSRIWQRAGYPSLQAWRVASSGHARGSAAQDARLARDLGVLKETDRALADGTITPDAALTISRLRNSGDTQARDEALLAGTEAQLLRAAAREDGPTFDRFAQRIGRTIDVDAVEKDHDRAHQHRYLRLRTRGAGLAGEFFLDSAAGQELRLALEAQTARPAKDDKRTTEQRAADALSGLAKTTLDSGTCKNGALVRPHVLVVMTEQTLAATAQDQRARDRGPAERSPCVDEPALSDDEPLNGVDEFAAGDAESAACVAGTGDPLGPEEDFRTRLARERRAKREAKNAERRRTMLDELVLPGSELTAPRVHLTGTPTHPNELAPGDLVPAAEFEDGTLVPAHILAAMLCDCLIGRIVVDAEGQPIDIGRERRTAIDDLRLAIIARDRTCRYPQCTMPARWSDYHHMQTWSRGGPTSINNGLLLCRFHHNEMVHARHIRITPIPGGFDFHDPDGTHLGTTYHATAPPARRRRRRRTSHREASDVVDGQLPRLDTALAHR